MYLFYGVTYKSLRNSWFVLIILYVHSLNANWTSEKPTSQVKLTDQPTGADSLIPIHPEKCCNQTDWLLYSKQDKKFECYGLPPEIESFLSNSSWLQTFSKFGKLMDESCVGGTKDPLVWTKSNAKNYRYFPESQIVFNLDTNLYYTVVCSDFINLDDYHLYPTNYSSDDFKNLQHHFTRHFLCPIVEDMPEIIHLLVSYGMGASNLLLVVTFCLYISTPTLHRKAYDKCFLCQLVAYIVAFSLTIWRKQLEFTDYSAAYYNFVGFMNQYWLLAAFTWLTVLCFDLWRAIASRMNLKSVSRKLLLYNLSAWGFPLLMSLVTFYATLLSDDSYFKVDFQEGTGWFQQIGDSSYLEQPEFLYFYSYVSLTLLVNACLFIHISIILITNDYGWQKAEDSRKHEVNKKRFCVYLKLFLIMGLTWVFEVVTYCPYFRCESSECLWWGLPVDLLVSIFPGFSIFIVSVCNTRVLTLLKERFYSRHKGCMKGSSISSHFVHSARSERSTSSKNSSISLKYV